MLKFFSRLLLFLVFTALFQKLPGQTNPAVAQNLWPRPVIVPVPSDYSGLEDFLISLNGTWSFSINPTAEQWNDISKIDNWKETLVPALRRPDQSAIKLIYKRSFLVPEDFMGKSIIIRFNGVSNAAKLWINGNFAKEHWGSFMPWTCDITEYVTPGKEAQVILAVDDTKTGLAAFTRGGGIQRDVQVFAVPQNYLERFHIETDLNPDYKDGIIRIGLKMKFKKQQKTRIKVQLIDKLGHEVPVNHPIIRISPSKSEVETVIPVKNPEKWDAEHPVLYTLNVTILDGNRPIQTLSRKAGFRKIEVTGRKMLLNGREIKLRGLWGGDNVSDMKYANINHTRQKWATEAFLDSCDKAGIYVLDENPVDFAKNGAESDSLYSYQWLSLISDLIERDKSHPSVIMWGLGNESRSGENILKTFRYTSIEDPGRPSMFSWSHGVNPGEELPYSVYSYHYPDIADKNLDPASYGAAVFNSRSLIPDRIPQPEIPVIADEYCHLVISAEELDRDPNVRNFWGESIWRFWEKMFPAEGCLGGDLFGLRADNIKEHLPEYWLIKKAYSPVRLPDVPVSNPGRGNPLIIPVKNWYDHTNLKEIKMELKVGTEIFSMSGPDIVPHSEGHINFPSRDWRDGEELNIRFITASGQLIDEYSIVIGQVNRNLPVPQDLAPEVIENEKELVVKGDDFSIVFDKNTGQITNGSYKGNTIITGGPHLQLNASGLLIPEWKPGTFSARKSVNEVTVEIIGKYGDLGIKYEIEIDKTGLINLRYTITDQPYDPPVKSPRPWDGSHFGGFSEAGIYFELVPGIDRISWNRKGLWSVYPADHIGRNKGVAIREVSGEKGKIWAYYDTDPRFYGKNFEGGLGSNDFRSMKESIYDATAFSSETKTGLGIYSDGTSSVRMEIQGKMSAAPVRVIVDNEWNYPTLGLGNYMKEPVIIRSGYSNSITLMLKKVE